MRLTEGDWVQFNHHVIPIWRNVVVMFVGEAKDDPNRWQFAQPYWCPQSMWDGTLDKNDCEVVLRKVGEP